MSDKGYLENWGVLSTTEVRGAFGNTARRELERHKKGQLKESSTQLRSIAIYGRYPS